MLNPSQDSGRTTTSSPQLSEPRRLERVKKERRLRDANDKGSATIWADSVCIDERNLTERWQTVNLMRGIYHNGTRYIGCIGPETEDGCRRIKMSRHTKKAIALILACGCAAVLTQPPSGTSRSKACGTGLPRGKASLGMSGPSPWTTAEALLRVGDQRVLHNVIVRTPHDYSSSSPRRRLTLSNRIISHLCSRQSTSHPSCPNSIRCSSSLRALYSRFR